MNPLLKKVLGEADGVIPKDAKEIDQTQEIIGKPVNPIVKVVQEPSHPTGEKEQYMTPYAALTAPDCTPEGMKPIDPSAVPGGAGGPEKFTAADIEGEEAHETGLGQEHPSLKAMDVLLGRKRMGAMPHGTRDFASAGAIKTEEEAAAALGIQTPVNESVVAEAKQFAATAVLPAMDGGSMPPPAPPGDGRHVLNAFRKFMG
jgi:hypothetical protein